MPAYARREIVVHDQVGVYHCVARCVRRAFLCGVDTTTGKDHEHRKEWIRERLQKLASIFAFDIFGYAVMSNHFHIILRGRIDLVQTWTDQEVALHWKRLYPPRDPQTGDPVEPSECDLNMILSDPARVAELRKRLSSLSWFMRCLSEPIARMANREDDCKGRFWEGRFKSQVLIDEAAILACSVYVDLNPVRAGIAAKPEDSKYTSAFDRIRSMAAATPEATPIDAANLVEFPSGDSIDRIDLPEQRSPDEWLCELTLREGPIIQSEANPTTGEVASPVAESTEEMIKTRPFRSRRVHAARVSNQGYLPITLEAYLSLLDWTGRQFRSTARGRIPAQLAPILERLGVNGEGWVDTVRHFGRRFKRVVGRSDSMAALAGRYGQSWFQGHRAAAIAFQ
jgi:REP element-mobilizing transposase RayT